MARMGPGFEGKSGGSRAPIKSLCRRALRGQLGAPMSDTSKDLVRRHFEEIWNQRKMAACDELMADDFSEHAAAPFAGTAPGKVHGPTAMRGTAEWLLSQFPDLSMRIESIVADGDMVAVRVRSTGTNSGKLNGFLPPSGKRFTSEQSHWFRIEDGKLAEHWATRDDLSSMLQLGVVTPPRLGALVRQLRSAAPYWFRGRRAHERQQSSRRIRIGPS